MKYKYLVPLYIGNYYYLSCILILWADTVTRTVTVLDVFLGPRSRG